jgi:trk system potassium uptake protein TrkA
VTDMDKNFLIIGLGRFGRHTARKLNSLGGQIMAVDKNEERVEAALKFVTSAQIGDSTNWDFISSLGVRNFDVCIVAIGDDFLASLETTSYLKELGAKKVVARAARDMQRKFLLRNGADDVVYPERDMGNWTAVRYSSENIFDYMQLDGDNGIFEITVPVNWTGKTIGELDVRSHYQINIMAVKSADHMDIVTDADYMLQLGQTLVVLGKTQDVHKLLNAK